MSLIVLEIFFLGLLGAVLVGIAWVSTVVLYKLFRGQR